VRISTPPAARASRVSSPVWRLQAQDYAHLGEAVDLQGYTENCLGLTGWTTCFDIALHNFARNILSAVSDLQFTDQDVIEDQDAMTIRTRNEGTHTGAFLGVPATGRRGAWANTSLVHTRDGRIVGQWVQPDLWGIYQQITAPTPEVPRSVAAEPPVEWAHSAR
jgi:predicted ester cyclase